ncbi:MAG TPA: hypothetical protein PKY27_10595 [Arachnia sp.]|nr:hypothetical protein [Arachnia sp.]
MYAVGAGSVAVHSVSERGRSDALAEHQSVSFAVTDGGGVVPARACV